jgi:predicted benzoate:H+ symporter BenE
VGTGLVFKWFQNGVFVIYLFQSLEGTALFGFLYVVLPTSGGCLVTFLVTLFGVGLVGFCGFFWSELDLVGYAVLW